MSNNSVKESLCTENNNDDSLEDNSNNIIKTTFHMESNNDDSLEDDYNNLKTTKGTKTLEGVRRKDDLDDYNDEDLDECEILPVTDLQRSQTRIQGLLSTPGAVPVNGINVPNAIMNDDSANTNADYHNDDTTEPVTNYYSDMNNPDEDAPYPVIEATLVVPPTVNNEFHNNNNSDIQIPEVSSVVVMDEQYMNRIQRNRINFTVKQRKQRHLLYVAIAFLVVLTIVGTAFIVVFGGRTNQKQLQPKENEESEQKTEITIYTLILKANIDYAQCLQDKVDSIVVTIYCGKNQDATFGTPVIRFVGSRTPRVCKVAQTNVLICDVPLYGDITRIAVTFLCEMKYRTRIRSEQSILANTSATIETFSQNNGCADGSQVIGTLTQFCGTEETKNNASLWKLRPTVVNDSCTNGTIVSTGSYNFCQVSSTMNLTIQDYVRDTYCINPPSPVSGIAYVADRTQFENLVSPVFLLF